MKTSRADKSTLSKFINNLPPRFVSPKTRIEKKLFAEYGALFVAAGGAIVPDAVIFKDENEVGKWHRSVETAIENIGGFTMELQATAMKHLQRAIAEAETLNLTITPRGADAARRSYGDTEQLWASRVNPALDFWVEAEKLDAAKADAIRRLTPFEQIPEIFKLEKAGMFCSKDLSKSIVYSVAPPGASQHLAMLAFDVAEFNDKNVRALLAKHLWYQTVASDLPHFTFLGIAESDLPGVGLKKIIDAENRVFWLPNI